MRYPWTMIIGVWAMMLNVATLSAFVEGNVTVQQSAGGPQVFVDGEAVPPKFFFGSPAAANWSVSSQ